MELTNKTARRRFISRLIRWTILLAFVSSQPLRPSCGRSDEFQCEEAAQHLKNCCSGRVVVNCQYMHNVETASTGCQTSKTTTTTREVDFNPELSACLLSRSCDEILDSGVCSVPFWMLPSQCTTGIGKCVTEKNPFDSSVSHTTCDEYVTCSSPPQRGLCTSHRPKEACDAMEKLSCP